MPILKNLPARLKVGRANGDLDSVRGKLILRKMSLNLDRNPFPDEPGDRDDWSVRGNETSLLEGGAPRDRNPFEDEEDENEANEVRRGGSGKASFRGTLDRLRGASPLKTLGKLGLRMSGRSKGSATPSPQSSTGMPSPVEKKKKGRRSSEGSLLR